MEHFQLNIQSPQFTGKDVPVASYAVREVHIGTDVGNIQSPWYDVCFGDQREHQTPSLWVGVWNAGSRQAIVSE